MATISRQLPQNNKTVALAISKAKDKLDLVPAADDTLRIATKADLNAKAGPIATAELARTAAKATQAAATEAKNEARRVARLLTTQFIQIFGFWVDRKKAPASARAYYQLNVSNGNVPSIAKDDELHQVLKNLVLGETARIAAGGPAMSDITLADLQQALDDYTLALNNLNTAKQNYDAAQEALSALCNLAKPLIKTIWDEVESKYANETKESQRANAKLWGVVYKSLGEASTISFTVKKAGTADQWLIGATIRGEEGDTEGLTDSLGKLTLQDTFVGEETFTIEMPGFVPQTITQVLEEGGTYSFDVGLVEI